MPHLLLIEDDLDLLAVLQADLKEAGYQVTAARSVQQGLIQAREAGPDLVIMDLKLPDGDGSEVVKTLRQTGWVPVIVLTARSDLQEKITLLDLGANDYLIKPCDIQELLARIAVQLRIEHRHTTNLGGLRVDISRRLVTWEGRTLQLSAMEQQLLLFLMEQEGRVRTRHEIAALLWPGQDREQSNVIDVHVANIREKLRRAGVPYVIRTVRGSGYALRLPTDAT